MSGLTETFLPIARRESDQQSLSAQPGGRGWHAGAGCVRAAEGVDVQSDDHYQRRSHRHHHQVRQALEKNSSQ